jgi:EAL domain-containing protein (putative c-di-GMP-specific phosphodiesterase class I)
VHLEDLIRCQSALAIDDRRTLPLIGLNLNGLQLLNDSHGTAMGNEVLSVISSAVQPRYARCGMFARVGQDEYLVALPHLSHPADAAVAAQGGRDMSSDFALHEDIRWVDRPSLKVVETAPPLLAAPKLPAAQNPFRQVTEILPDTQVETQLTDAIQRHSIGVHFQPQYETDTGRGCGMEALARWTLSNGQTLLPGVFIPVAERLGMIGALGASVLENTCATASQWKGKDAERMTISVNVATQQIGPEFSRMLSNVLKGSGLPPSRLELEIEESALVSDKIWVFDWLKTWQQLGIRIAVNHAGLNYTALKYLSRVHIDRLKLDQSLVRRMTEDQRVTRAVHAVIALGEQLEVDVLAEGVETPAQLQLLRELGCRHVQGFLLARPMPAVQAQLALRKAWGNLPRSALPRELSASVS